MIFFRLFTKTGNRVHCLLLFMMAVLPIHALAAPTIKGLTVSTKSPTKALVTITLDQSFQYKYFRLEPKQSNDRLVVDFKNSKSAASLERNFGNESLIQSIRTATNNEKNYFRIVFDLKGNPSVKFSVNKNNGLHQLNLQLNSAPKNQSKAKKAQTSHILPPSKKVIKAKIMIDAGHGGVDPGATAFGTIEKKVVFSISNKLAALLRKDPYFEVLLTRPKDKKVPLVERVRLANKSNADVFISIHADALPSAKYVKGASVYTLSEKASDRMAQRLARNENSVDGFEFKVQDLPVDLRRALSDIQFQATLGSSHRLANTLLKSLKKAGPLAFKKPHSANFAVLRSPIASVLVETGFLTNQADAKRLRSERGQNAVAQALYQGLKAYKNRYILPRRPLTTLETAPPPNETEYLPLHVVQSGETLYTISRLYGRSIKNIKNTNALTSDRIYVGQKLIIPK